MKIIRGLRAALLCALAASAAASAAEPAAGLSLSSPALVAAAPFPERFVLNMAGCSGGNSSPPLAWTGAPAGTQSFALTLFDPDERGTPSGWWHWVVYDIPAAVQSLPENAGVEDSKQLPPGAQQGRTDLGNAAYHGPCPAAGDPPHRYTFTLYALDVATLDVPPAASGAMVTLVAGEHVLAQTTLVLRHGR